MANADRTKRSHQFKDMTQEPPFGFLRVIERSENRRSGKAFWNCLCDQSLGGCGATVVVSGHQLRSGRTKSCGCLRYIQTHTTTHGMGKSPEYRSWAAMKTRCTNKNSKCYADYGGRGITICERWLNSFENFYADMGPKPSPQHTLDRVDNSGNYEPGNVIWATRLAQAKNRRMVRLFTIDGKSQCISDWAKERGVNKQTVLSRLRAGLSIEEALRRTNSQ